jgi:hypothetical protein
VACFDHGYSRGFERAFNSARSTSGWVEALILVVLSATTLICAGCGDEAEQLERLGPVRRLLLPLTSSRRWPERGRPDADAAVDDSNALTVGPKPLRSLGGAHEQPRLAQWIPSSAFVRREVSRQRPSTPCMSPIARPAAASPAIAAVSDRSAVLHCGCESRRCACWPPDGWRLASRAGCSLACRSSHRPQCPRRCWIGRVAAARRPLRRTTRSVTEQSSRPPRSRLRGAFNRAGAVKATA